MLCLSDLVGGKPEKNEAGEFLRIERTLEEVHCDKISEYIRRQGTNLSSSHLKHIFPKLADMQKKKILFLDTENCGLEYKDPIFLIGLAHLLPSSEVRLECLFARDYSEERAILYHLLGKLKDYEAFFTYCGSNFDIPRIEERARQISLPMNGYDSVNNAMRDCHQDLYPILKSTLTRQRIILKTKSLQTVEKLLFGFEREDDLSGQLIPRAYFEYVWGMRREEKIAPLNKDILKKAKARFHEGTQDYLIKVREMYQKLGGKYKVEYFAGDPLTNEERTIRKMARTIEHNFIDLASTVAILAYVCKK